MRSKSFSKGFTLIELLVVIAIIALLLSVIVPSIRKAKEVAKRMICGTNLHQIQIACVAYANDNNDYFPSRGDDFNGYPHSMMSMSGKNVMDEQFFKPYLSDMRDKVLFCPGALYRYRNPEMADKQYDYTYITYQYYNYSKDSSLWSTEQPDLKKYTRARQTSPLWGCLTVANNDDIDAESGRQLVVLSHNMVNEPHIPDGMNGVNVAGDAGWKKWDQCSSYLEITPVSSSRAQQYFWPKPDFSLTEE